MKNLILILLVCTSHKVYAESKQEFNQNKDIVLTCSYLYGNISTLYKADPTVAGVYGDIDNDLKDIYEATGGDLFSVPDSVKIKANLLTESIFRNYVPIGDINKVCTDSVKYVVDYIKER